MKPSNDPEKHPKGRVPESLHLSHQQMITEAVDYSKVPIKIEIDLQSVDGAATVPPPHRRVFDNASVVHHNTWDDGFLIKNDPDHHQESLFKKESTEDPIKLENFEEKREGLDSVLEYRQIYEKVNGDTFVAIKTEGLIDNETSYQDEPLALDLNNAPFVNHTVQCSSSDVHHQRPNVGSSPGGPRPLFNYVKPDDFNEYYYNESGLPSQCPTSETRSSKLLPTSEIEISESNVKKEEEETVAAIVLPRMTFYEKNFVCNSCFEVFPTAFKLTEHKIQQNARCERVIRTKKTQLEETVFQCDFCDYKTPKKCDFRVHTRVHTGEKPFSCDHWDDRFVNTSNLIRHKKKHKIAMSFECTVCNLMFPDTNSLKGHRRLHIGEKRYKCKDCEYRSTNTSNLIRHNRKHKLDVTFACFECPFVTNNSVSVKEHRNKHSVENPFKCDSCEFRYAHTTNYLLHKDVHSEKKFVCDLCGFKTGFSRNFTRHLQGHKGDNAFKCEVCGFVCGGYSELKLHGLKLHVLTPFKCGSCEFTTAQWTAFKKHNLIHDSVEIQSNSVEISSNSVEINVESEDFNTTVEEIDDLMLNSVEKWFKCDTCRYKSKNKFDLIKHFRKHTGEKPFYCDNCDYKCTSSSNLTRHKRKHNNLDYEETLDIGKNSYRGEMCDFKCINKKNSLKHRKKRLNIVSTYKCKSCEFVCNHRKDIKEHKRIHDEEKTFECDKCSFKTVYSKNFTVHKMKHTNEKPFNCDKCGFKCDIETRLNFHIKIRHPDTPFKCQHCNFVCLKYITLKKHRKLHSKSCTSNEQSNIKFIQKSIQNNDKITLKYDDIIDFVYTEEKPYKCDLCPFKSKNPSDVRTHRRKHTGEKPFHCDVCVYKCARSSNLVRHKKTHHSGVSRKLKLTKNKRVDFQQVLNCDFCEYTTGSVDNLKSHIRIHISFKCDQCKDTFGSLVSLKVHKKDRHPNVCKHTVENTINSLILNTNQSVECEITPEILGDIKLEFEAA